MALSRNVTQGKFLGNNKNKSQFIHYLREELKGANIMSQQCVADADLEIVLKAIDTASKSPNNKVVIVSEDTDVLTILAARTPPNMEVFLLKPPSPKVPDVVYSSESLSSRSTCIRSNILLLHAFTGCDTTSAFYYYGKKIFCNDFEKSDDLHGHAEVFKQKNVSIDCLIDSGLRLALALYGASREFRNINKSAIELVNSYRVRMYGDASQKKKVDLSRIIPTANALTEHIKRVYFQVQAWYRETDTDLQEGTTLNPLEWGWELENGELSPVAMTQEAGPEEILNIVSCSCEKDCGNRCGCRRNGLDCTMACKHCDGNCSNQKVISNRTEDSDEEEEEGEKEEEENEKEEELEDVLDV